MRGFKSLLAAMMVLAAPIWAASAENTMVIKIAGQANGVVEIALDEKNAPNHVARIKRLVREGKYDGVVFHRVINGFMAQTGDVQHGQRDGFDWRYAGTGGSDLPNLKSEFSKVPYEKGVVGMARAQHPDSANSQFFIMFAKASSLNGQYTVVGKVIAGQDVVDQIKKGSDANNGAVQEPDYMKKVSIKADEL